MKYQWLTDLPTTNVKTFIGQIAAVAFIVFTMIVLAKDVDVNEVILGMLASFILVQQGISAWQYGKKRDTYKPVSVPDIEDVPKEK